eukprot:NODE_669_length_1278_cov_380.108601_g630_i0.p1 GENE.NODE_669_length_1278_cov_380.108601_g630_i0~~NODE_669_length_1278_cov_380.108601_g630_i0.p1  ORF type:complete len:399 (+),score=157.94 NODE_669_length_1278_cov_380.108601_g630_i0:77-1198(+)
MKQVAAVLALATAAQATFSLMFATPNIGDGDWGVGGAGAIADAFCAGQAGGDLNYIALLSFDGTNMKDRALNAAAAGSRVVNSGGAQLSASYVDMFNNGFTDAPVLNFDGSSNFGTVWTGSDDNGDQFLTCQDVDGNDQPFGPSWVNNAALGNPHQGGGAFPINPVNAVSFADINCNVENGLYCFQTVPQSSGTLDPHFYGFNGEKLDIEHDEASADRVFSVFCTENVEVNALFSSTVDGLLFMTKFWMRFQESRVTYSVSEGLQVAGGAFEKDFVPALNRTRYAFDNGLVVEQDAKMTRFNFNSLKVNVAGATLSNDEFLNVDIISANYERYPAGGLVGRTMTRRVPAEEFAQYEQFKLEETTEYFNTKCVM